MVKYLEDHNRAGEVDTFKKNINGVMKNLLGKFKDLQFYQGERRSCLSAIDFNKISESGINYSGSDLKKVPNPTPIILSTYF